MLKENIFSLWIGTRMYTAGEYLFIVGKGTGAHCRRAEYFYIWVGRRLHTLGGGGGGDIPAVWIGGQAHGGGRDLFIVLSCTLKIEQLIITLGINTDNRKNKQTKTSSWTRQTDSKPNDSVHPQKFLPTMPCGNTFKFNQIL